MLVKAKIKARQLGLEETSMMEQDIQAFTFPDDCFDSHFVTKLFDAFTQIAPELYSEYCQSNESLLVKLMRDRVALYFRN